MAAALFGVSFSVVSSALITSLLSAWSASKCPALHAYRSGPPVEEVAAR